MKIYHLDAASGQEMGLFDSRHVIQRMIARAVGKTWVRCFYLGEEGLIGYHQASLPQLFLVVQGEGWVRDETSGRIPLTTGQAVFWEKEEWHETGSSHGLTALVMEGEGLDPEV